MVVDDRSIDATGEVAAEAIEAGLSGLARVVRRADGADGKAATLASADDASDRPIAILVLDADARVDPSFLARCRRALVDGSAMVTARRRVLRSRGTRRFRRWLVEAQAAEQAADDVVQRGRLALGGAGELRGDGMLIRADLLADMGGWPADALAEDLDLSTLIYLRTGFGVARPPGLEVWEQAPITPRSMLTQRLRWAEGSVRRDLGIVLPALADSAIPLRRRIEVAVSAGQDLMPWIALGLVARETRLRHARPVAELALGYGVAAATIALVADEPGIGVPPRVAGVLGLGATWAGILPVAWLRVVRRPGRPAFRPTPHLPGAAVRPPPFATAEDPPGTPRSDR